jgi:hypothetical protein
MKEGQQVYRLGWNGIQVGKTIYVYMIADEVVIRYLAHATPVREYAQIKMNTVFILYDSSESFRSVWHPSMVDTISDDWTSVQEDKKRTEEGKKLFADAIELIDNNIPKPNLKIADGGETLLLPTADAKCTCTKMVMDAAIGIKSSCKLHADTEHNHSKNIGVLPPHKCYPKIDKDGTPDNKKQIECIICNIPMTFQMASMILLDEKNMKGTLDPAPFENHFTVELASGGGGIGDNSGIPSNFAFLCDIEENVLYTGGKWEQSRLDPCTECTRLSPDTEPEHKCYPKTNEEGSLTSKYSMPNNVYPCIGCDKPMTYRVAHLLIIGKNKEPAPLESHFIVELASGGGIGEIGNSQLPINYKKLCEVRVSHIQFHTYSSGEWEISNLPMCKECIKLLPKE